MRIKKNERRKTNVKNKRNRMNAKELISQNERESAKEDPTRNNEK